MIKAFWYSRVKLGRGNEINFGDELSRHILEKISDQKVVWLNPKKQNILQRNFSKHIFAIGSILHFGEKNSLIWGSGLIEKTSKAPDSKYYAVRGKYTQKELASRGYKVPNVYGDPALLTSKYFNLDTEKKYKVGIIPHYVEFELINQLYENKNFPEEFSIIDLRKPVIKVLKHILECEFIISSSLHGLIVPQSYEIPSLRVSFTNRIIGDGIKYRDYFDSVGIFDYAYTTIDKHNFNPIFIEKLIRKNKEYLLIKNDLINIQDNLLKVKPF